jgi:hypothetical protein
VVNKKSQGLSINVIIIVAIALIGRMGSFVKGVDTTATCKSSCAAFGREAYTGDFAKTQTECEGIDKAKMVPGTYEDVPAGKICCCEPLE